MAIDRTDPWTAAAPVPAEPAVQTTGVAPDTQH
jgi:hypothetical protein